MEEFIPEPVNKEEADWKKPLNTVTPLSKYFALALFVALPFLGFWIGYNYSLNEPSYTLVETHQQNGVPFAERTDSITMREGVAQSGFYIDVRGNSSQMYIVSPSGKKAGLDGYGGPIVEDIDGSTVDSAASYVSVSVVDPEPGEYELVISGAYDETVSIEACYSGVDAEEEIVFWSCPDTRALYHHDKDLHIKVSFDPNKDNEQNVSFSVPAGEGIITNTGLSDNGTVTFSWYPSDDPDVVKYRVYRREESRPVFELAEETTETYYDTQDQLKSVSGIRWIYTVVAVAKDGTESFIGETEDNEDATIGRD